MGTLRQSDAAKGMDVDAKAHSAILLSLADEVLREISSKTLSLGVWEKLQTLYMKRSSLANRL